MVKQNFICMSASAAITLGLPWLAAAFVPPDSGMAALLLILFIIHPVTVSISGIFAGRHLSSCWFQPFLTVVFTALGNKIFFDMDTGDFMFYGVAYFLIGAASMAFSVSAKKR